jgi:hypothetical protein
MPSAVKPNSLKTTAVIAMDGMYAGFAGAKACGRYCVKNDLGMLIY